MGVDKINARGLTSLFTAAGFVIMSVTGIAAYIVPQGRIAYWTDWVFLGLTKTQWGDIHIISSLLFVIAGAFHIYFNWKPFWGYIKDRVKGGLKLKRELALTGILSLLIILSGISPFPPFGWLLDLNAYVKAAWVISPDYEPPFGHAEEVSLKTLSKRMGIDGKKAVSVLKAKGLTGVDPQVRIIDLARANRMTPMAVFALIKHLEPAASAAPVAAGQGKTYTADEIEDKFAGTGIGSKTLPQVAAMAGQSADAVKARLDKAGLKMAPDQPLKIAADANGLATPLEMLKTMLVDGYQPRRK